MKQYFQSYDVVCVLTIMVFYHSLRLAPRCPASTLVIAMMYAAIFGASLSKPHTSVTALRTRVCIYLSIYLCLFGPTTYRKFLNQRIQIFHDD